MSEINVISRQQRILIYPESKSVSIINIGKTGPPGATGPAGPTGPTGPTGASGTNVIRTGTAFPTALYDGEPFFRTDLDRPFIWSAQYNEWMPNFVNKRVIRQQGGAGTATLASYIVWPPGGGIFVDFTKHANATDLIIGLTAGGWFSAVGGQLNYGYNISLPNVNHGIGLFYIGAVNDRRQCNFEKAMAGAFSQAKGTFRVTPLVAVVGGAATFNTDAQETFCLSVEEVWPQSLAQI